MHCHSKFLHERPYQHFYLFHVIIKNYSCLKIGFVAVVLFCGGLSIFWFILFFHLKNVIVFNSFPLNFSNSVFNFFFDFNFVLVGVFNYVQNNVTRVLLYAIKKRFWLTCYSVLTSLLKFVHRGLMCINVTQHTH